MTAHQSLSIIPENRHDPHGPSDGFFHINLTDNVIKGLLSEIHGYFTCNFISAISVSCAELC